MEMSRWQTNMWGIGVQDRKHDLTLETSSEWKKLYLNESCSTNMKELRNQLSLVFGGIWGGALSAQSPRGKHYSRAQPTFHTGKHTTHQPRSHPLTTERFPIPGRRMAPFISNQSSISVQQKVWDIILRVWCNKSWPRGLCFNNPLFFSLWNRDLWQEAEKETEIAGLMKCS